MIKYTDFPVPAASDTVNAHLLSANTHEEDTLPAGAKYIVMTASTISYFCFGVNAAIPGDITDGTACDTLPAGTPVVKAIPNYTRIGNISSGTAALTVDSTDGLTKGQTIVVKGADTAGADLTATISAINQSTKVVTLGSNANTTVAGVQVIFAPTTISLIAAGTPIVTLAYYR